VWLEEAESSSIPRHAVRVDIVMMRVTVKFSEILDNFQFEAPPVHCVDASHGTCFEELVRSLARIHEGL
jgi:hypothetical protein